MPKLCKVLEHELGSSSDLGAVPQKLLDGDVVGIFLNTGAPCDSHAGAFAEWPGGERDVSLWFRLACGSAAGIRARDGVAYGVAVWEAGSDG